MKKGGLASAGPRSQNLGEIMDFATGLIIGIFFGGIVSLVLSGDGSRMASIANGDYLGGYQPETKLDQGNPPSGGSGVPPIYKVRR